ncbi:MAG: class I SAM-dependent methyltransferase [Myxococcota bacterium]|jgi:SAM-dependent methyltransferase|nr:class I SAM-dependent methyltransferase [Myxococcota bacterium]
MDRLPDFDEVLKAREMRNGFLKYTREALALLPAMDHPRILDIGCGSGSATMELMRLSGSEVVGIDTDAAALSEMRQCLETDGLGDRVEVVNTSLLDVGFPAESFDVLWEEGVLHLLDSGRSLPVCHRLLKPGGFLVMHETVAWFEGIKAHLLAGGFCIVNEHLLPKRCWWTDYYAPLEERIRRLREERGHDIASAALAQHEREIAMVKADPDRFDCGFFILQKARSE